MAPTDPEIPRSGDNGLGTGPLILRQLGQNSETPFPYRPLVSVMLVKLLTIWHGRNNSETNPVLSEQRPVFKENRRRKIRVCRWICPVFKENSQLYTGTKGAVDAITGVLANELGARKIRVNAINPGIVETEGTHAAGFIGSEFEANAITQTPLGRTGQPAAIAAIAVFLASADAGWITGEKLTASGGLR